MTAARLRIVTRLGSKRSPLPPFVLLSVVLHAGLVAGMLLIPGLLPKKPFPMQPAINAILLPSPPPQPAAQETAPAAEAEPEPEPSPPTQEVTAAPEVVPDPDPPPKPKPKPKKTPDKPKPTTQAPKQTSKAASKSAKPATGGTSQGPVGNPDGADALAGMSSEFNWYRDAVARALYSSWRQPALNAAEPVEVAVAFEIVRSGAVRGVRIERESGLAVVDRSVLRAVHEATLPPLPRNHGQSVQPAVFVFRLYPE